MLLSLQWLSDFIDLPEELTRELTREPARIADMLTMSGHEVEAVEDVEGSIVLDINITPNRADCLSVVGIARELAAIIQSRSLQSLGQSQALGGVMLKGYAPSDITDEQESDITVKIQAPHLCYRYTGRVIRGIRVSESMECIRKRLRLSGVRSINNVVDITNYVMLERGQPLHAFDLSTLSGRCISIRALSRDVRFHTLDGVERDIATGTLMVCDKKGPIAVAGVMGGLNTEVSETTTDIFLESACFNPTSVRKTSKTLNLKSESSYRFERGVDIEGVPTALDMAALLITGLYGGRLSKMIDVYPERFVPREISLTTRKLNKVIGIEIGQDEVEAIFKCLHFDLRREEDRFIVTPPSYRGDIEMDADLIEEVVRLYGYEKITPKMPHTPLAMNKKNKWLEKIDLLKDTMRHAGFTETINYSFTSADALDILTPPGQSPNSVIPSDCKGAGSTDNKGRIRPSDCKERIRIKNPLSSDQALLRTSLVSSLIQNFLYNLNHGLRDVHIYETGTVFLNQGGKLPLERPKLGALAYYGDANRLWREGAELFFQMKGVVEGILDKLFITQYELIPSKESFLMPGLALDIWLKNFEQPCGYVGMLSTEVINRLDINTSIAQVAVMEVDLEALFMTISEVIMNKPLLKYPFIERDISLVVDNNITADSIIKLIKAYPDRLIESSEVFDYYTGSNLPEDKKSLAFHVIYRAADRTLTDREIDTLHRNLVDYLMKKTLGTLR
ncbi:MAG: phenylalanine--tRNA ligase subunit beta [Nitrospirae bacterium]|nr:phenylalanine--tRNA ligase subunit beta [Nitrospirota bacterium]MBF0591731.1 phenylalanine--tRNA ligase subunit beta [Nitrospirota bacterium]